LFFHFNNKSIPDKNSSTIEEFKKTRSFQKARAVCCSSPSGEVR
jgi:hypothetical protein